MESILKPYFQVVGKGFSGLEAIDLYTKMKPDLLLLDITMPNCDGKESLQKILSLFPNATIVMVSGIGDMDTVKECLELGAKAFVNKGQISATKPENCELLKVVNYVLDGNTEKVRVA
tara:strand:- start:62220 stop:62573 length:354 start_codon:yes stop_codon:yes gene_type:complete